MLVKEYKTYFQNILGEYKDSPLSAYFSEDIDNICNLAELGDKAKNNKQREEYYKKIIETVQTFNDKITASLGEVVKNFKGEGANSPLKGTFYYTNGKQNDGTALETEIVNHANTGIQAKTFKEKETAFINAMTSFDQYVNNSLLAGLIKDASQQNIDASKLTLRNVYNNSLKVENILGYRTNQHVRDAFDKNPTSSHQNAMPFKYYTTVAGIKLGKITSLTPALLDDFKWIKKGAPHLLPKGLDPEDPNLLNDKEKQKAFLETLSNQYSENDLKNKLLESRNNFLNDEVVRVANIENTLSFQTGRMTMGKGAGMTMFTVATIYLLSMLAFASVGMMEGMEGNFFELAAQNVFQIENLFAYSLIPGAMDATYLTVSGRKDAKFKERYNQLSMEQKKELFNDIKKVLEIEDKKERDRLLGEVNKKYNGVLGEKKGDMKANFNVLAGAMLAFDGKLRRRINGPLERKALNEKGQEIAIKYKENILKFAKSIGLSEDNPFFKVVDDLVSKINGYQRGTTTKLAYQGNNSNVVEKPGQEQIVQNDTHVVSTVNNDTPIISDEEIGLNKAINTVKEKIADGMVKSKTIQLDQAGYEIQVVKNGIMSRIVDLDKQINRLLPRIKEVIKEGDEEEFIIQNEKGKKPVKIGKIAVGKTITPGQDQIVVTVKKKNPKPSDGGRK